MTIIKGQVKRAARDRLTVTGDDHKDWDLLVAADTRVIIDARVGKAEDIKVGSTVTVTERDGKVVTVEAQSPAPPPPAFERTYTGQVLAANQNNLILNIRGVGVMTFVILADTRVTIDGMDSNVFNIQANWSATVKMKGDKLAAIDAVTPK